MDLKPIEWWKKRAQSCLAFLKEIPASQHFINDALQGLKPLLIVYVGDSLTKYQWVIRPTFALSYRETIVISSERHRAVNFLPLLDSLVILFGVRCVIYVDDSPQSSPVYLALLQHINIEYPVIVLRCTENLALV